MIALTLGDFTVAGVFLGGGITGATFMALVILFYAWRARR